MEIKNKKGFENLVADYLSRLENIPQQDQVPVKEEFLDEFLLAIQKSPWYADLINFVVSGVIPSYLTSHQRKKFIHNAKYYF